MNKNKILLAAMSSSIAILFLATMYVSAPVSIGPLYTCQAVPDPTVDGHIDKAVEWKDGIPIGITLYAVDDQANTIDIEIMSVFGLDNLIYYGVTIPDTAINPEDYFQFVFRTHEVNPIIKNATKEGAAYGAEHDMKMIWFHNNHSVDCFTKGNYLTWADDVSNSGVDNGVGKVHNNGTHTTLELMFPFVTGDSNGFDVSLFINGTAELFLLYHDEDTHTDFSQIRTSDVDWDFIKQEISCKPTPIPLTYVFFGIMTTAVASILIKKRRK